MATTDSGTDTTGDTTGDTGGDADRTGVERLEALLEEWRAKIDELLVQADLASKDVAQTVRDQAAVAQNAWLAAKNRLKDLPRDAGANVGSARAGIDKLVDDMRQAYQSAEAVIRRGPVD